MKSGSLNLLEPSGPVQACNGIALAFFVSDCLRTGYPRIDPRYSQLHFLSHCVQIGSRPHFPTTRIPCSAEVTNEWSCTSIDSIKNKHNCSLLSKPTVFLNIRLNWHYFINSGDEDIRDSQPYLDIMGSFHALHTKICQVCVLHSFVPVLLVPVTGPVITH